MILFSLRVQSSVSHLTSSVLAEHHGSEDGRQQEH